MRIKASPWMNQTIIDLKKSRNKAFYKYSRMKDLDDFENYQVFRNLVQKKIKVVKRNFINDQL